MFERFTDRARRVVVAAQDEARLLGHNHIGSEHLLLGLLDVQGGVAVHALESAGITAEAARVQVEEIAGPGDKSPRGHIPFTPRAKKILELSLREALEQHKSYIGTEHILLAVIRDDEGIGAQVLERLGGSLPALRQRVLETDIAATPETAAEAEGGPQSVTPTRTYVWAQDREGRLPTQSSAFGLRRIFASFDQRLANIERHLEIAAEAAAGGGFTELHASVDRRLANIERHLGIATDPGAAAETPAE